MIKLNELGSSMPYLLPYNKLLVDKGISTIICHWFQ